MNSGLCTLPLVWNPLRIVVEGDYAFLSTNDGGVYIYEVKRNKLRQVEPLAIAQSEIVYFETQPIKYWLGFLVVQLFVCKIIKPRLSYSLS